MQTLMAGWVVVGPTLDLPADWAFRCVSLSALFCSLLTHLAVCLSLSFFFIYFKPPSHLSSRIRQPAHPPHATSPAPPCCACIDRHPHPDSRDREQPTHHKQDGIGGTSHYSGRLTLGWTRSHPSAALLRPSHPSLHHATPQT